MNVVQMRQCVRCGSSFRPFDIEQMCCSELCSTAMHSRSLLPVLADRRPVPVAPSRPVAAPRSGRRGPIFVGSRFVVFEWQVEQLIRMLGPLIDDFDIHEWFFTLDARMANSAEVIPQRDGGQWLQARTLDEAQRRGMPVAAGDQSAVVGKQTSRLAQALANIKRGFS